MAEATTKFVFENPVTLTFGDTLFTPRAIGAKGKEQGKVKFSANFEFLPDHPDFGAFKVACAKVAREKWPERELSTLKFPFSAGDKLADKQKARGKDREFSRGKVVLVSRSEFAPVLSALVNGQLVEYIDATRAAAKPKFFFGADVLFQVSLQAYEGVGENPDGVTAYLDKVLAIGTGERIGGGQAGSADVFKGYIGTLSQEDPTGGLGIGNIGSDGLGDEIPF